MPSYTAYTSSTPIRKANNPIRRIVKAGFLSHQLRIDFTFSSPRAKIRTPPMINKTPKAIIIGA